MLGWEQYKDEAKREKAGKPKSSGQEEAQGALLFLPLACCGLAGTMGSRQMLSAGVYT